MKPVRAAGRRVGTIPAQRGSPVAHNRESVTALLKRVAIPPRAVRLHIEAGNCLDIAVAKQDAATAAELIDEAIRLARRARELVAGADRQG